MAVEKCQICQMSYDAIKKEGPWEEECILMHGAHFTRACSLAALQIFKNWGEVYKGNKLKDHLEMDRQIRAVIIELKKLFAPIKRIVNSKDFNPLFPYETPSKRVQHARNHLLYRLYFYCCATLGRVETLKRNNFIVINDLKKRNTLITGLVLSTLFNGVLAVADLKGMMRIERFSPIPFPVLSSTLNLCFLGAGLLWLKKGISSLDEWEKDRMERTSQGDYMELTHYGYNFLNIDYLKRVRQEALESSHSTK